MTTYTFAHKYAANYGRPDQWGRSRVVTIPDQVYEDQKSYDGRTFPAIREDGVRIRVRLDGDAYGLHTAGTGDPVVKSA